MHTQKSAKRADFLRKLIGWALKYGAFGALLANRIKSLSNSETLACIGGRIFIGLKAIWMPSHGYSLVSNALRGSGSAHKRLRSGRPKGMLVRKAIEMKQIAPPRER